MKSKRRRQIDKRKRRIDKRLGRPMKGEHPRPMFQAANIQFEIADRTRGIDCGGIGAFSELVRSVGLARAIDEQLQIFKIPQPYHESDHVLSIAYNVLCGGTCLEDLERRRNDEAFLDALGADRIPDPTTAGDFCRRFRRDRLITLMDAFNQCRLEVWAHQPAEFFAEAILDVDGTVVATEGAKKFGMDLAYNRRWGYHPLLITLANTGEPLFVVNRPGSRPSHEGAAEWLDRAIALCRQGGFRKVYLRGDTDFSQTQHLDHWHEGGVEFRFGFDNRSTLAARADSLDETAWKPLERPAKDTVKTQPRRTRPNVKERIVREREFENLRLESEEIAEFRYRPVACHRSYRMIVLRKNITREKGEVMLFDDIRYFFYITNDEERTAAAVVFRANDRCNQENLIEQLKNGTRSLRAPLDNLISNWAYLVMASLAWTLKAWFALRLPVTPGRWAERHRQEKREVLVMEFKRFVDHCVRLPAQILRTGRRLIHRLLAWNHYQPIFFRLVDALRR